MEKKNLLSIGELSKITGVHIKALRYYDSLGILTPAFVDPKSGYRYYTFCQKAIVDAIQFCIELDIPLKHFNEYTNEAAPWICYKDLVDCGTNLIEEKIQIMQERLALLKTMQKEIERSEQSFQSQNPERYFLPERACWIAPYENRLGCNESNELMKKLIMEIYHHNFRIGNAGGLLLIRQEYNWKQYLFVDIDIKSFTAAVLPEVLYIPAGWYLCKKVESSNIHNVWNWCLQHIAEKKIELVIETELFVGNYTFLKPVLEQRCFLKE